MKKKVLFGLAIAGVTIFAIYKMEQSKKNYTRVSTPKHPIHETETEEENCDGETENVDDIDDSEEETVKDKIKRYAIKFVNYILEHRDQIEALSTVIAFSASVLSFVYNIRKFSRKSFHTKQEKTKEFPGMQKMKETIEWMLSTSGGEYFDEDRNQTLVWEVKEAIV